jgi:exosortase
MNETRRRLWVLAAATVLVLGLAYGPMLVRFFSSQWQRPHYQYFPFVIGAFALLLWQRCAKPDPRHVEGTANYSKWANALLAGALALLAFAYLVDSPWLAYVSLIGTVTSIFLQVAARWSVPYLWGIWLLLWLILPLPLSRDQQLISFLQHVSSQLSSFVLDWVGVPHLMEGNTLLLVDKQFFVDEACSGIVSVLSIIACAVIFGVWRNRAPMHLFTLALAGVGWATMMNVLRISVIAIVYESYGVDWSKGTPHEILGLVIFLCTFLALVSTDYALEVLLAPIKGLDGQLYTDSVRFGRRLVDVWDWLVGLGRPMALASVGAIEGTGFRVQGLASEREISGGAVSGQGDKETRRQGETEDGRTAPEGVGSRLVLGVVPLMAFAVVASLQLVVPLLFQKQVAHPTQSLKRALALSELALPKKCATVDQVNYERHKRDRDDMFGNFSRTYEYRDDHETQYLVSCDFPLEPDGHELTVCYQGIGWTMERRELREAKSAAGSAQPWGFAEAEFSRAEGERAFLVFCSFDEYGGCITPQSLTLWNDIRRTLVKQIYQTRSERTFQVQVWTTGVGEIDEEQKQTARELLLEARERFRTLVVGNETSSKK